MVGICAVDGCNNKQSSNTGLSFHSFPKTDGDLLEKWKAALCLEKVSKRARICGAHFSEDAFCKIWSGMTLKRLRPDAVPTIFTAASKSVPGSTKFQKNQSSSSENDNSGKSSKPNSLTAGEETICIELDQELVDDDDDDDDGEQLQSPADLSPDILSTEHTYSRTGFASNQDIEESSLDDVRIVSSSSASSTNEIQVAAIQPDLRRVLQEFQKVGYLCDTVLIGEDGCVRAHSVVLAAANAVFKSALISSDSPMEHFIVLPGIELWLLRTVVHYLYTGEIQVTADCATSDHLSKIFNVLLELGCVITGLHTALSTMSSQKEVSSKRNQFSAKASNVHHPSELELKKSTKINPGHGAESSLKNLFRQKLNTARDDSTTNVEANKISSQQHQSMGNKINKVCFGEPFSRLCHKCGKSFNNSKQYVLHQKVHARELAQPVHCPACGKKCANRSNLRTHMYLHTGERPHLCQHCGEGFIQRHSLDIHMTSHHMDLIKDDPIFVRYQCPTCGAKFFNRLRFQRHLLANCCHSGDVENSRTSSTGQTTDTANIEKPYACEKCTKRFRLRASLIIHNRVHTKLKQCLSNAAEMASSGNSGARTGNVCETCAKWFKTSSLPIPSEELTESSELDVCSICSKKMYKVDDAEAISVLSRPNNEMPFACRTCAMRFRGRDELLVHKRSHTGGKPFGCPECSYRTSHASWLSAHMRIHTSEKPYVCDICSKQYRHFSHLTRHMGVHTGEKPYLCPLCEKGYRNSLDLRLHCRRLHQLELPKCQRRRTTKLLNGGLFSNGSRSDVITECVE